MDTAWLEPLKMFDLIGVRQELQTMPKERSKPLLDAVEREIKRKAAEERRQRTEGDGEAA